MPRGDRTGPEGFGPRTGRGAGYCEGYDAPGYANPDVGYGRGRGVGWGRGRGRGRGRGGGMAWRRGRGGGGTGRGYGGRCVPAPYPEDAYPVAAPPSKEEELELLNQDEKSLENTLKALRKRKAALEKEEKQEK